MPLRRVAVSVTPYRGSGVIGGLLPRVRFAHPGLHHRRPLRGLGYTLSEALRSIPPRANSFVGRSRRVRTASLHPASDKPHLSMRPERGYVASIFRTRLVHFVHVHLLPHPCGARPTLRRRSATSLPRAFPSTTWERPRGDNSGTSRRRCNLGARTEGGESVPATASALGCRRRPLPLWERGGVRGKEISEKPITITTTTTITITTARKKAGAGPARARSEPTQSRRRCACSNCRGCFAAWPRAHRHGRVSG
jgi:hypothetical protein